jgi:hypothetical protein
MRKKLDTEVLLRELVRRRAAEVAFGRVRDQIFTITLSTSLKDDFELNRKMLRARIYTAAEQFAGNLF